MADFHALVIGAGATGSAVAHDLALRGLRVTLVERGEVTSGTTGRLHGLLHSGGRYAVKDQDSACECIQENRILRRIAPGSFEENGGLFVAVTEEDVEYSHRFLEGCAECDIPTQQLTAEEASRLEPNLSPDLILAVRVPDATMEPMRLVLRFLATAKKNGAEIKTYTEVVDVLRRGHTVTGARVKDHTNGNEYEIGADVVINAAGPWSGQVGEMAGVHVPIQPSPGVMLALRGRLCNMVINRMAPSGDGDIIVPERALSVVGTTSWAVDDPDDLGLPKDHIQMMYDEGAKMIPLVNQAPFRAAWSAARPLIGPPQTGDECGRELSRTFQCFAYEEQQDVEGFVTIAGGKGTTLRAMAERTADVVCDKLGVDALCRTRKVELLPHTAYYS